MFKIQFRSRSFRSWAWTEWSDSSSLGVFETVEQAIEASSKTFHGSVFETDEIGVFEITGLLGFQFRSVGVPSPWKVGLNEEGAR